MALWRLQYIASSFRLLTPLFFFFSRLWCFSLWSWCTGLDYMIMRCCCIPTTTICLCVLRMVVERGLNHQSKSVILLYKIYPTPCNIPLNVKSDLRWNTNFNCAGCKWSYTKSCCKKAYKASWEAAVEEWKERHICLPLYLKEDREHIVKPTIWFI